MRYLITGGAGFIGSHLAERLLAEGHSVLALDDLSTGRYQNVAHLERHAGFELRVASVTDPAIVERCVTECAAVFHLASAVGVRLVVEQPVKTIETIVNGTDVVLRAAACYRRPVLITSTSEVYGKGSRIPFSEGDDCVMGPTTTRRWAYACAKMLDEFLALAHWTETRLPVVVARLFNTVGPRQTGRYGMVIPRFIAQGLAGEPITVYGDGTQTRCFAHVADVVGALIGLVDSPSARGEVFNVGNDEEVSILDLAGRVRALTGDRSPIRLVPYGEAYAAGFEDMLRRVPDLTKIRRLLHYRPTKGLDRILADVLADQQSGQIESK
jgi:UDP-glucose 4-epimerase